MHLRTLYPVLKSQADSKKISVLIGPRQVGKTTLIKTLHQSLGGLFLDLDVFSNFERVSSYENLMNTLTLEGYKKEQKQMFYLFLDEFQRYADLTRVLKNVVDHHDNIKIYVTGSSSLTIKDQIQESLAGRKTINHLYPLSFEEYLIFKGRENMIPKIKNLKQVQSSNLLSLIPELDSLLQEFLVFGGYPEVVLAKTKEEKKATLESIFDLYVKKDLVDHLRVEKIQNAKTLIETLAVNHGGIASYSELGRIAHLDTKTAMNYVEILKETFLLNVVRPWFTNKNKEISKAPKIYFLDNGVRNFFINNFNPLKIRADSGVLFESFYMSELLKRNEKSETIKYYRNKNQIEVDVILDRVSQIIPIELKYNSKPVSHQDLASLKLFMKTHAVSKGFLVNLCETGISEKGIEKMDCFNDYF